MKTIQISLTGLLLLFFINLNHAQVQEWANLKKYQAENQSVKTNEKCCGLDGRFYYRVLENQ